jgi:hypothetical protein
MHIYGTYYVSFYGIVQHELFEQRWKKKYPFKQLTYVVGEHCEVYFCRFIESLFNHSYICSAIC